MSLMSPAVSAAACTTRRRRCVTASAWTEVPPRCLSVAGSDSGGGAGVQADLKTFAAFGVFGITAVTSVTAQNSRGVQHALSLPPSVVAFQMASVLADLGADAIKTGLLPTRECVEAVAQVLHARSLGTRYPLVVDPVLVSTSGHALAEDGVTQALRDRILPLALVLTPNLPEAASLLGRPLAEVAREDALVDVARALAELGPQYVLLKGGHLPDDSDAVDLLLRARDGATWHLRAPRVRRTRNTHGTGCTLSAAITAEVARGASVEQAVRSAKAHLTRVVRASAGMPLGDGAQGAMDHGMVLRSPRGPAHAVFDPSLYCITANTAALSPGGPAATLAAVVDAVAGGATAVQMREKELPTSAAVALVSALVAHCRPRGVVVLVNDRVDVALAADADGAHIGQDDLPVATARATLGPRRLLGVSAKTTAQAAAAADAGADYLGVGACFASTTKSSSVVGVSGLAAVCAATTLPVVAIGGLQARDGSIAAALRAGAAGVAVVSAVFGAGDVQTAAAALRAEVEEGRRVTRLP